MTSVLGQCIDEHNLLVASALGKPPGLGVVSRHSSFKPSASSEALHHNILAVACGVQYEL